MKGNNGNIGKKQVVINMAANIVSYSANIIISFILTPFLIKTLGKETYGFYPIANTIVGYLAILMNAMNSIASRFVTVSLVQNEKDEANKYFSSTLAANLILSAILVIPIIIIVVLLDRFMDVPIDSVMAIKALFAFVFASAIVNIAASVFGIATFAKNRIDLRSVSELATAVIRLVLFFVLYRFLTPSIVYVGLVTFIVALINILFQITYTRRLLPEISLNKKYLSVKHTKELFGSSCWTAINSFGNALLAGMSIILSNMFYGSTASGSYSIVNTVPQFMSGVIVMIAGVFYPVITYKYAANDKTGLVKELKTAQSLMGLTGCAVISVFSALAAEFFALWTPGEDAVYLSQLSFVTILPHFVISCMWSLMNLTVVMNKVKTPAIFTLGSGIANVLVSYIVYKVWSPGLMSLPVISSVLQIIWVGVFIPLYACRKLQVKWSTFYPALGRALACSAVVIFAVVKLKSNFTLDSWPKFILFGGAGGIVAVIAFGLVMIGPKNIKFILNEAIRRLLKR